MICNDLPAGGWGGREDVKGKHSYCPRDRGDAYWLLRSQNYESLSSTSKKQKLVEIETAPGCEDIKFGSKKGAPAVDFD